MIGGIRFVLLMLTLGAPKPAVAARPDFNGIWKLDLSRSDFGRILGSTPPTARTDTIQHRGDTILVSFKIVKGSRDEMASRYTYITDGKERESRVSGQDVQATAAWEGDVLAVESRAKLFVLEFVVKERWSLARDRRTLVITRDVKSPFGRGEQTLRFSK